MDLALLASLIAVATPPFLLAYNHPDAYRKVQPWISGGVRIAEGFVAGGAFFGWRLADSVQDPAATHKALVALIPPWWWFLVLAGIDAYLLLLLGMPLLDVVKDRGAGPAAKP